MSQKYLIGLHCGVDFQNLIALGKKENLYESIFAYKWMKLLAVLLVKEGECGNVESLQDY